MERDRGTRGRKRIVAMNSSMRRRPCLQNLSPQWDKQTRSLRHNATRSVARVSSIAARLCFSFSLLLVGLTRCSSQDCLSYSASTLSLEDGTSATPCASIMAARDTPLFAIERADVTQSVQENLVVAKLREFGIYHYVDSSCRRAILYAFCDLYLPRCPTIRLDENWGKDTITSLANGSQCRRNYTLATKFRARKYMVSRCRFVDSYCVRSSTVSGGFVEVALSESALNCSASNIAGSTGVCGTPEKNVPTLPIVYNPLVGYDRTSNYTCDSFLSRVSYGTWDVILKKLLKSATDVTLAGIPTVIGARCASSLARMVCASPHSFSSSCQSICDNVRSDCRHLLSYLQDQRFSLSRYRAPAFSPSLDASCGPVLGLGRLPEIFGYPEAVNLSEVVRISNRILGGLRKSAREFGSVDATTCTTLAEADVCTSQNCIEASCPAPFFKIGTVDDLNKTSAPVYPSMCAMPCPFVATPASTVEVMMIFRLGSGLLGLLTAGLLLITWITFHEAQNYGGVLVFFFADCFLSSAVMIWGVSRSPLQYACESGFRLVGGSSVETRGGDFCIWEALAFSYVLHHTAYIWICCILEHSVVYHMDLTHTVAEKTHQTLCARCKRKCWCFLYVFYTPDSRFKRHQRLLRYVAISVPIGAATAYMDRATLGYNGFSAFCLHRSFPLGTNLPIPVGLLFAILAVCVSGIIFMGALKVWCKRKKSATQAFECRLWTFLWAFGIFWLYVGIGSLIDQRGSHSLMSAVDHYNSCLLNHTDWNDGSLPPSTPCGEYPTGVFHARSYYAYLFFFAGQTLPWVLVLVCHREMCFLWWKRLRCPRVSTGKTTDKNKKVDSPYLFGNSPTTDENMTSRGQSMTGGLSLVDTPTDQRFIQKRAAANDLRLML